MKKHHARKYTSDRFKNPYFSGKKIIPWTKRIAHFFLILTFVIGIPWLVIILPWFYIDEVTVNGSITLEPDQIQGFVWNYLNEKRWDVVPQNHIWLIDAKEIKDSILSQFALQDVEIQRDGRSLIISVQERVTSLIWAHSEQLYFVDQEGLVVRELNEEEINDVRALLYGEGERQYVIQSEEIFVVFEQGGEVVSQNSQVILPNAVEVLTTVNKEIEDSAGSIESIEISEALSDWAVINMQRGFAVYLDLNGNAYDQLSNLKIILDEYNGDLGEVNYIDLRFGNRVFVK